MFNIHQRIFMMKSRGIIFYFHRSNLFSERSSLSSCMYISGCLISNVKVLTFFRRVSLQCSGKYKRHESIRLWGKKPALKTLIECMENVHYTLFIKIKSRFIKVYRRHKMKLIFSTYILSDSRLSDLNILAGCMGKF